MQDNPQPVFLTHRRILVPGYPHRRPEVAQFPLPVDPLAVGRYLFQDFPSRAVVHAQSVATV